MIPLFIIVFCPLCQVQVTLLQIHFKNMTVKIPAAIAFHKAVCLLYSTSFPTRQQHGCFECFIYQQVKTKLVHFELPLVFVYSCLFVCF